MSEEMKEMCSVFDVLENEAVFDFFVEEAESNALLPELDFN